MHKHCEHALDTNLILPTPHPPKRLLEQEKVFILISSTVCIFIYILVCQAGRLLRICVFTHICLGLIVLLLSFPITLLLISTRTLPSPEFPLLALCLSDDPPHFYLSSLMDLFLDSWYLHAPTPTQMHMVNILNTALKAQAY